MPEPSVKGLLLDFPRTAVREALEQGRLTQEQLELRLDARSLEIVDRKPEPSLWYPITCHEALVTLADELNNTGGSDVARDRGREVMTRLLQAEHLNRIVCEARRRGERAGSLVIALPRMLMNFGDWKTSGGLDDLVVEASDVAPLHEPMRFGFEGSMEALIEHLGGEKVEVWSDRPTPDTIVFRLHR